MSTKEDEKKRLAQLGLGRLLEVVATSDGYIETDPEGKQRKYSPPTRDGIELKNLNVVKSVDATSGAAYFYLHSVTKARYRPLGAEKGYVLDVVLSPRFPQNKATINVSFAVVDHGYYNSYGFRLHVGLSQVAIEQIIHEARPAATPRELRVVLAKPSIFEGDGSLLDQEHLLPYWGEQHPGKRIEDLKRGDRIELEWSFDIREVIVRPTISSSRVASEFDQRREVTAAVHAQGEIAVHGSPEREQAIKLAYEQLLATLKGVRSALNLITIAVILIAVKLWLR